MSNQYPSGAQSKIEQQPPVSTEIDPCAAEPTHEREGQCPYIELTDEELRPYVDHAAQWPLSLVQKYRALILHQYDHWRLLHDGLDKMHGADVSRTFDLSPQAHMIYMYRPGRATSAQDHHKAKEDREKGLLPCRLCAKKDDGQRGIHFTETEEGSSWILANPWPIHELHTTITLGHIPQEWATVSSHAFALVEQLNQEPLSSPDSYTASFLVFYNGAEVGASSPDHAHIQAAAYEMPIEADALSAWQNRVSDPSAVIEVRKLGAGVTAFIPTTLGRSVLVIAGPEPEQVQQAVQTAVHKLPIPPGQSEPNMNIALTCKTNTDDQKMYYAYVFPRTSFRAKSFPQSADQIGAVGHYSISCATLEMGGDAIIVLEQDHKHILDNHGNIDPQKAAKIFADIFAEVSMPVSDLEQFMTRQ